MDTEQQAEQEQTETHEHRWMRYADPETEEANHWCIDGDTGHHAEPCVDAEKRAGDHAGDPAEMIWLELVDLGAAPGPE